MSAREYLGSVVFVLAVMAVGALLEAMVPLFARPMTLPGRRTANLAMTVQTLLFAFVLTSAVAVAAVYLPLASPGFMAAAGLPAVARFVLGIVALDLAYGYLAHLHGDRVASALAGGEAQAPDQARDMVQRPIATNPSPATIESVRGLTIWDRAAPASTPIPEVITRASAEAVKTVSFGFSPSAAKSRVASWVLSPSSARNTLANTVAKSFGSIRPT